MDLMQKDGNSVENENDSNPSKNDATAEEQKEEKIEQEEGNGGIEVKEDSEKASGTALDKTSNLQQGESASQETKVTPKPHKKRQRGSGKGKGQTHQATERPHVAGQTREDIQKKSDAETKTTPIQTDKEKAELRHGEETVRNDCSGTRGQGSWKKDRPQSGKGKKPISGQTDKQETPANPRKGNRKPSTGKKHLKPEGQAQSSAHTQDAQTPQKTDLGNQRTPGSDARKKEARTLNSQNRAKGNKKKFKPFEDYLSLEEVSDGLKKKWLIKGTLRINPRNFEESYIDSEDGGADIMISGLTARNRALEGDIVAVELLDKSAWKFLDEDYKSHQRQQSKEVKTSLPANSGPETEKDPKVITDPALTEQLQSLEISSTRDETPSEVDPSVIESPKDSGADVSNSVFRVSGKAAMVNIAARTPETKSKDAKIQDHPHDTPATNDTIQDHLTESLKNDHVAQKLFSEDAATSGTGGTEKGEDSNLGEEEDKTIPSKFFLKQGKIVFIIEKKHSRASSGFLKPPGTSNAPDALFVPTDYRVPRIYIPLAECPDGFLERPRDFEKTLFIARIQDWPKTSIYAKGHLHRSLGEAGEIEPETEAMLVENEIDFSDFSDEVLDCLPNKLEWTIPQVEIDRRRDLRSQCVFTIDPATARDLDDALSCTSLGDGIYEVGVHIADVSFFVDEGNALDSVAGSRATSVYLVQKVIPMLPRVLCENLCSLHANIDRLTFSFLWKLTETGEILDEWCGRTIIRSCVKMSYERAQDFINEPEKEWGDGDSFLHIGNDCTLADVAKAVLNLDKIAKNLRRKRMEDGALRLDQVKLQFALSRLGMPTGYSVYQQRDSNRLIEEFMLLANMAAAHRIKAFDKKTAILRRHPPPKQKMLDTLIETCTELGLEVDGSSSKAIQVSMSRYLGSRDDLQAWGRGQVLTVQYSKPMQRAKYFCTGTIDDEELYRHYALSVPLYTHFTSPIRRYADIMVHRQLAASLGIGPVTERDKVTIQEQAIRCNDRKEAAKKVSDMSSEMFFAVFIRECGPIVEDAMVMQVLDHSIDVLALNSGVVKRVYLNAVPLKSFKFAKEGKVSKQTLVWEADDKHPTERTQIIRIFLLVKVELKAAKEPLKFTGTLKHPDDVTQETSEEQEQ